MRHRGRITAHRARSRRSSSSVLVVCLAWSTSGKLDATKEVRLNLVLFKVAECSYHDTGVIIIQYQTNGHDIAGLD
jgi:hypothetical protein